MNVLVTSISKKVPLLKEVKRACLQVDENSLLFGADTDKHAIGRYFVDYFWLMPPINQLEIEELIDYCMSNKITAIIPTRDGELPYFSRYRVHLEKHGIVVMVSGVQQIDHCLDKLSFYIVSHDIGFPVISTASKIEELTEWDSFVIKERFGAGSKEVGINLNKEDAVKHATILKDPIFQPFIEGEEYSVDIYIEKQGQVKGVIARKRELVVHGESQITTTVTFPEIEEMCSRFVEALKLYGHVVMQVIVDKQRNFHIIECNPRFGGASTLSLAAGLDSFTWFLTEVKYGHVDHLPFERSSVEIKQIRYPQDKIIEIHDK
ncbi:ATP-grasp domain-containing protein [Alkalihalobacterium sp. APHAB7]|uniref:ATP-grasp domain-containing protein n=1 Tax=Alkalihalobacterium sp. APHAB7 TaxID=3402081 RepID=UPI003AAC8267